MYGRVQGSSEQTSEHKKKAEGEPTRPSQDVRNVGQLYSIHTYTYLLKNKTLKPRLLIPSLNLL